MLSIDAVTAYALAMGLLIIFLLVWLVHRQRTAQGFSLWLASGVVGMLLGSAASYAMVMASGHIVVVAPKHLPPPDAGGGALAANTAAGGSGMAGMAPGGPPTAPPLGSGGGGGMGGGGRPNPKRDLTTLVRKLNLLTDDVALKLNSDQTTALVKGLSGVDDAEKFSDDDAKKMYDDLFAVLSDEQKAKLDAVGLPFGGRPGGGGGGGMGGGGMGGMGGGAPPDPETNPFKQENNLKALKSFRSRFDSAPPTDTEVAK